MAKQDAASRAKWDKWQTAMQAAFDKASAFKGRPELQRAAWDRFLSAYSAKNPYGNDDDRLRTEAATRKASIQDALQVASVTTPVPSPSAGSSRSPGSVFRDCPDCPEMVVIPAGNFTMGSAAAETTRVGVPDPVSTRERPQHAVSITRSFALGKYHVTRGEFAAFVGETGYDPTGCYTFDGSNWNQEPSKNSRSPGFTQTDRDPVVCVSDVDAQHYISWLNGKVRGRVSVSAGGDGPYRLPSEAEWEYAARAGTTTARFWGDDEAQQCVYANGADLTAKGTFTGWTMAGCSDGYVYTSPVGSFRPNPFGLYDMLGNAWEWTADCWNDTYGGAPNDGSVWTTGDCVKLVARGGSWSSDPRLLRSADRFRGVAESRYLDAGFRLARTLP